MHIIFEKSSGHFRSNCNILTLAWMPYYNETKFRQALFEYHQRQLLNLSSTPTSQHILLGSDANNNQSAPLGHHLSDQQQQRQSANEAINNDAVRQRELHSNNNINQSHLINDMSLNGRLVELQQRFNSTQVSNKKRKALLGNDGKPMKQSHNATMPNKHSPLGGKSGYDAMKKLDHEYGQLGGFGWLVIGNIGRVVGVTLTSTNAPPIEQQTLLRLDNLKKIDNQQQQEEQAPKVSGKLIIDDTEPDLIELDDDSDVVVTQQEGSNNQIAQQQTKETNKKSSSKSNTFEQLRPDKISLRNNYNLRGHLDEVILCKWNELYQKLATVDAKGNVLIWCKVNEKFTIQTPFYNRTKSVADFQWSNDGKTALICYTDSFILVGSSTGQRHWHSMLNLEDYHITCGSWTPNDEQLLLGVSNGNIVVIDLPRSDLTELVVSYANIRAMSWSNSNMTLAHLEKHHRLSKPIKTNENERSSQDIWANFSNISDNNNHDSFRLRNLSSATNPTSNIVNQRRLSRDCSVFSRYRFCSQPPNQLRPNPIRPTSNNNQNQRILSTKNPSINNNNDSKNIDQNNHHQMGSKSSCSNILAIDYANNVIELFEHGIEDPSPRSIQVNLESYIMQWSSDAQILAVAGFNIHTMAPSVSCIRCLYLNTLKFYNRSGELIYERALRYTRYPITAITWAHDNQRLFIATGPRLHCAKVFFEIPELSLLSMSSIARSTRLASKSDAWKCLTTRGLFSLNALDWQSKNCPINLWLVHKRIMQKLATQQQLSFSCSTTSGSSSSSDELQQIVASTSSASAPASDDALPIYHHNANVFLHNLPMKLKLELDAKFCSQTIRQPFEACMTPSDIIWTVPKNKQRIYCTLVCYTSDRKLTSNTSCSQSSPIFSDLTESQSGPQAGGAKSTTSSGHKKFGSSEGNISSDQFKIFVLYVEFAGSFIPILRARRVGILKPEFVIFDPQNNEHSISSLLARRQHKVADINLNQNEDLRQLKKMMMINKQQSNDSTAMLRMMTNGNGCTSLHNNYAEDPDATQPFSRSSSGFGAQKSSVSDAHDYCIFDNTPSGSHIDRDNINQQQQHEKIVDLLQKRSHHQEPLPSMPSSSHEAYINYIMSLQQNHTPAKTPASLAINSTFIRNASGQDSCYQSAGAVAPKMNGGRMTQMDAAVSFYSDQSVNNGQMSILLTEKRDLIRIKSNIWGTRFKILNESNSMIRNKAVLGSLVYKASLLHLQPRQIFLQMKDMSNYCSLCSLHHHTQKMQSNNEADLMQTRESKSKSKSRKKSSNNISAVAKEQICLLDAPLDVSLSENQPRRTKIQHNLNESRDKTPTTTTNRCPNEKIVLAVGNALRIAPSLDPNQKYKFSNNHHQKSLRGASLERSKNVDDRLASNSNDQLLMLGLDRTNQMQISMTTSGTLPTPPATPKRASSLQRQTETNSFNISSQEKETLAQDKTLKSIKDITQMIVDLSERSKLDEPTSSASMVAGTVCDLPSPSKLIKIRDDSGAEASGQCQFYASRKPLSPVFNPALSSSYIPPDTPVHRPRRRPNNPRMLGLQSCAQLVNDPSSYTQSASTTPVKRKFNGNKNSNHQNSRGFSPADQLILRPPPKEALKDRISSSAKRLFDDSIRSLSLQGSSSANLPPAACYSNSVVEPEESEPLVRQSRNLIKRLQLTPQASKQSFASTGSRGSSANRMTQYLASFGRSHSALTTPEKRNPSRDDQNNVASSFMNFNGLRNHIAQRFRQQNSCDSTSSRLGRALSVGGDSSRSKNRARSTQGRQKSDGYELCNSSGNLLTSSANQSCESLANSSSTCSSVSNSEQDLSDDNDDLIKQTKERVKGNNGYVLNDSDINSKLSRGHKMLRKFHSLSKLAEPSEWVANERRNLKQQQREDQLKSTRPHCSSNTTKSRHHSRSKYRKKAICNHANCLCSRELKLKNRPPLWNELSQVYQLDFGGRVTQESAKNLQIDFEGSLIMQQMQTINGLTKRLTT